MEKTLTVLPALGLCFPLTWQAGAGPRTSSQRRCLQIGFVWRAPLEAAAELRAQAPQHLALHSPRSSAWDTQPQCFHLACSWSGQHQLPPESLPDSPRELCCGSHEAHISLPLLASGRWEIVCPSAVTVLCADQSLPGGRECPAGSLACSDLSWPNRSQEQNTGVQGQGGAP